MRARIAATVTAAVVVALVLVGLSTFVLMRAEARRSAQENLTIQTADLAELLAVAFTRPAETGGQPFVPRAALQRISEAATAWDVGVIVINAQGQRFGRLPDGVELSATQEAEVSSGGNTSGRSGDRLYAVEARPVGGGMVIVGLTGADTSTVVGAGGFLIASAVVIAASAAGALRVGSRLAEPVQQAADAAQGIAAGNLATRLPDPPLGRADEPAVLARSLNTMAGTLERSRLLEQQFLLSISHDLRTPLSGIQGYASAIADGVAGAPHEAAEVILAEARRLGRLIDDLLDLARLDSREFQLRPRDADAVAEAQAAAQRFDVDLARKDLELDVQAVGTGSGHIDTDRLSQIIGNLVVNASNHARSRVVVKVSAENRELLLSVSDDGPGIKPEDLRHVFERLYRARKQPRRTESGSGLGLAIVRDLVAAMDGQVTAGPALGGGAQFEVRLPLADPTSDGADDRTAPIMDA